MGLSRHSMFLKTVALPVVLAGGTVLSAAPAFADTYRLDYKVSHSKYGNIGTYSNTVDSEGENTTVTTRSDIAVRVIGITAYRQTAQRQERWNGDHLLSLHASTEVNGKRTVVDGEAQGDHFQVTTAKGTTQDPVLVRVANPWSPELMNGDTIITPDDGSTSRVHITQGRDTVVKLTSADVPAKLYDIDLLGSGKRYQVWFDTSGTPIMFNMTDDSGTVTFKLDSRTPAAPQLAEARLQQAAIIR